METDRFNSDRDGTKREPASPAGRPFHNSADLLALATLAVSGVVVGWPVLTGGYATYLDNPAHVAEVYAAAFEAYNGWSEIAFCGFPIATLHSPLWYGALTLLARVGLPVGAVYAFFVWLGYVAPAGALYAVARRSLAPVPAVALAYLLMVQRPAIVGVGSAFGGMWTFYLAAAAFMLLVDRLARPQRSRHDPIWVAALVGIIVLTHLYALIPLALLALLHVWLVLARRRGEGGRLVGEAVAGAVGMVAAAVYWVPLVLARNAVEIVPQNLSAWMVAARLAIPTNVLELVNGVYPRLTPQVVVESAPMVVLLVAGGAGVASLRRRRDDTPLYGAFLAAILLSTLLLMTAEFDVRWLGPGSWRMLYFARIGLALASIPVFSRLFRAGGRTPRWRYMAVVASAVVAAWWFGSPLRSVTPAPRGAEMAEVEALWNWTAENRTEEWGRVYVQDTFERPRRDLRLSQSHVLALTAHRTGVRQLGATYGVVPYRTAFWTPGEFGMLYRVAVGSEPDLERVTARMRVSNATHIVTSDVRVGEIIHASDQFERLYAGGRFAVFRAVSIPNEWASPLGPEVEVVSARFETGRYRLKVRARSPGNLLVKSSYHPAWRFSGLPKIHVHVEESGLIQLRRLPVGETEISMTFRLDRWPRVMSALGWLAIAAGLLFVPRRSSSSEMT